MTESLDEVELREPVTETWARVEERQALEQLLGELTPQQREVVVLRFYLDLSVAETAELLGIAEGTVKSAAHRGLAQLRGLLSTSTNEVRHAHGLAGDLEPHPRLYERVLAGHARRRRVRVAGTTVALTVVAGAAVALTSGGAGSPAPSPQLQLASFKLRLPEHSQVLAPGSHRCLPAMVMYPGTSVPSGGPANPTESAIVSAVTAGGGCISVLLTSPFTPDSSGAPTPFMDEQSAKPVHIGSYQGTAGPATWIGSDMSYKGITIPSGTTQSIISLQVPEAGGHVEDLVFAAEGVSEQQLISIVSAGLTATTAAG